jgi:hypothetical protein
VRRDAHWMAHTGDPTILAVDNNQLG